MLKLTFVLFRWKSTSCKFQTFSMSCPIILYMWKNNLTVLWAVWSFAWFFSGSRSYFSPFSSTTRLPPPLPSSHDISVQKMPYVQAHCLLMCKNWSLVNNAQIVCSIEVTYVPVEQHGCPQTSKYFYPAHEWRHPGPLKIPWKCLWSSMLFLFLQYSEFLKLRSFSDFQPWSGWIPHYRIILNHSAFSCWTWGDSDRLMWNSTIQTTAEQSL